MNGIIPVVLPTEDEVRQALTILDMLENVDCAYCGDTYTEWDHLRPLVVGKQPTGYISEIHNLVPACGKCNQSKGNKPWREWMLSQAALSPRRRGVPDLDTRIQRLCSFEEWMPPTVLDFSQLLAPELWAEHWRNYDEIIALMRHAELTAAAIREAVKQSYLAALPDARE